MLKYLLIFSLTLFASVQDNEIPPRLQWMSNTGYCGEASLISAGLYYGQYMSQYDVRAIVAKHGLQTSGSLLVGVNDTAGATEMRLKFEEWDSFTQQTTDQFLAWIKNKIVQGYPVVFGIYVNEFLYDGITNPHAGDPDYDHIVIASKIQSKHPLNDPVYYGDDIVTFCDMGIWPKEGNPPYFFDYSFDSFQKNRVGANSPDSPIYSLSNNGTNYGIAITGVADKHGDTLPIRITTNNNWENPPILEDSNDRPAPSPITLTITISNLEPNVPYNLYRYNNLAAIPQSKFNKNHKGAVQNWTFQIDSGSTHVITQTIQSNETAAYRCVKASSH